MPRSTSNPNPLQEILPRMVQPIFRIALKMICCRMAKRQRHEPAVGRRFDRITAEDLDTGCMLYEECGFIRCSFANADFAGITFRNCIFESCDLSLARLRDTSFQEVRFVQCKLLGLQFGDCRKLMFNISFGECMLKLSSFNGQDLRNTSFEGCDLQEADFTGADLSGSAFDRCDLLRATFFRTNLESTDFRTACNYSISPEENRLRKARFTMPEVTGLLDSFGIEIE
jgi:fluoroquinolone resistance protein